MPFDLRAHVAAKPIMDAAFERHLRTDPIFQRVTEARRCEAEALAAVNAAIIKHIEARKELEAAEAEAALMAHLEGLDNE